MDNKEGMKECLRQAYRARPQTDKAQMIEMTFKRFFPDENISSDESAASDS
jgi:hypothetical protein